VLLDICLTFEAIDRFMVMVVLIALGYLYFSCLSLLFTSMYETSSLRDKLTRSFFLGLYQVADRPAKNDAKIFILSQPITESLLGPYNK
jgi:hypothetical protein